MLNTVRSYRGMVTAPHHLASEAGLRVLREGGNAIEATIAMAATLCVVYPHMTGLGGDGFWLIGRPGETPVGIDACGRAAAAATAEFYRCRGLSQIPVRGPLAANMTAATVAGWDLALRQSSACGGTLSLSRLVEDAVHHAEHGFPVTASQSDLTAAKRAELESVSGFADTFLPGGEPPTVGTQMRLPALGETLRQIGIHGADGFYRGALSARIAEDLCNAGSPVSAADLAACEARLVAPLAVTLPSCRLFNFPPPTQGLSSLMILALFARLGVTEAEGFDHLHGLIEATKQAFLVRDRIIGDPQTMTERPEDQLGDAVLDQLAGAVDMQQALEWPMPAAAGDTVWMGAVDGDGLSVSFIQSIYFEFGSGVVLPQTGITWQNRGSSFQLLADGPRALAPGRRPFHTLNPAMATFEDGRHMVYGTMGGEGQPQTQAALFSRYALFGQPLQLAITAPRWLLGRTWGDETTSLKVESRIDDAVIERLRAAGHRVERVEPFTAMMGHAGAIVRSADGLLEGASDPRSDGQACGF
ncbi:gamma-glutamyltransferase family protein [Rhizobium halophytocola]|uniref:Gamma-glutamyltranspeptidase/glutathione hydrolase n=1 Tax=Rhizobium halophytocola TaxID=735519 RepID=A0ABS4DUT6_9HYPH|nr:gamma-glutamyltransferase family protein [Rhizobium halophytocola]MBP1849394.1 gamma-glutamyltranspeptidase/glutathione hydrolase [Rhizobium halophytocola]